MAHNYDVGTRAWQPDVTEGWVASEVKSKKVHGDKVTLVFELDNGDVRDPICYLKSSSDYVLIIFGLLDEDTRNHAGGATRRHYEPTSPSHEPGHTRG